MTMQQWEYFYSEYATPKDGPLNERVMHRLNHEAGGPVSLDDKLDEVAGKFRGPHNFSLLMTAFVAVAGVVLLLTQAWIPSLAVLVLSGVVAFVVHEQHFNAQAHLKEVVHQFVNREAQYWAYANLLSNSEKELCDLGFPVQYRNLWIKRVTEPGVTDFGPYAILAIDPPDTDEVPIDYLPNHIQDADSFPEAQRAIDRLYELDQVTERNEKTMLG